MNGEMDWREGRVWSEETVRGTPGGNHALDQYYQSVRTRTRVVSFVALCVDEC